VLYQRIETEYWEGVVRELIAEHVRETQSRFAEQLLIDWRHEKARFWQIVPKEMIERLEHPFRAEAEEEKRA
jgi:glutamate synthase (NADPH/NADH) large chain